MERWEELIREASEQEVKDFVIELVSQSPGLKDAVIMEFCDEEDLDQELINKISENYKRLYDRYLNMADNRTADQARAYTQRLDVFVITDVQPLIAKNLFDGAFRITREIFESNSQAFPVATLFGHLEEVQGIIKDLILKMLESADDEQRGQVYKWLLEQKLVDESAFKPQLIESILDQFIDNNLS